MDGFDARAMGYVAPALSAALDIPRAVLGPMICGFSLGVAVGGLAAAAIVPPFGSAVSSPDLSWFSVSSATAAM